MADNTTLPVGTGGDVIATDELTTLNGGAVSGFKVQRTKPGFGVDGDLTDVSKANPLPIENRSTVSTISVTAATGVAVTATVPAPAAGLFNYITFIDITLYATAARTGAATPVLVTTTNITGGPVFNFPTAQAIGTVAFDNLVLNAPIKSTTAGTATTFVCPIATTGIWRVNIGYYQAT
jgi:hypothetical protein